MSGKYIQFRATGEYSVFPVDNGDYTYTLGGGYERMSGANPFVTFESEVDVYIPKGYYGRLSSMDNYFEGLVLFDEGMIYPGGSMASFTIYT